MIEGLRHLPWLQRQLRDDRSLVDHLADCKKCKMENEADHRRAMGCGYEKPIAEPRPWQHTGYTGEAPTTCPGFTTRLPQVIEVSRIRMHAKNGMARDVLDGTATEHTLRGIEVLESADADATFWRPPQEAK